MREYEDIVRELYTRLQKNRKGEVCYRGVPNKKWKDLPSLFRSGNFEDESELLNEIVRHYPDDFVNAHTIDVLTQMQHYGCPTRMLDVTTNFNVALFFACGGWDKVYNERLYEENKKNDGEVRIYCVPTEKVKSIDSETVTLISNLAKLEPGKNLGDLMWLCTKDQNGVWYDEYPKKNIKDLNDVFLVKTKLNNNRIRAQYGEFFLFGGIYDRMISEYMSDSSIKAIEIKKQVKSLSDVFGCLTVRVPYYAKERILNCLDKCFGISILTLCPDKYDFIRNYSKSKV